MKIPFNKYSILANEVENINSLLSDNSNHLYGGGRYNKECEAVIAKNYGFNKVLLTSSCTAAIEISALALKNKIGAKIEDAEIIIPSFTFITSANSFAKFGFKLKFVDIEPDSLNLDLDIVEKAINSKTVAIVAVNYGGVSCNLNRLREICDKNNLYLIEDAAQSIGAKYDDKFLGSFGDLSTFSFHETKNITSGEGGCLVINNKDFIDDVQIIRDKGSNREKFVKGLVDKYSWSGIGGHYIMSEINASFLRAQLDNVEKVNYRRNEICQKYREGLLELEKEGLIQLMKNPRKSQTNGHIFWLKLQNKEVRDFVIDKMMSDYNIMVTFHYVSLHSSQAGQKYGELFGEDKYTTVYSESIIRLPLFYSLIDEEVNFIIDSLKKVIHEYNK